jgi:hypothetical protein
VADEDESEVSGVDSEHTGLPVLADCSEARDVDWADSRAYHALREVLVIALAWCLMKFYTKSFSNK